MRGSVISNIKLGKRKCKICGEVFQKKQSLQFVCSPKCAIEYVNKNKKKKWKKEKKEWKQKNKSRSELLSELQTLVNRYVLLRDKHQPCISCGTTKQDIDYHAGHFYGRKAYPSVRFDLDNIFRQCGNNCNLHLSGNVHEYRVNLIKIIGQKRFDELTLRKNGVLKMPVDKIQEEKKKFRLMIKEKELL